MTKKRKKRRIIAGFAIAAAAFTLAVVLPFTDILEYKSLDLRFALRGPMAPRAPILIVAIDDDSFIDMDRRWPWPRTWFAQAIDVIAAGGAKAIGLDVSLSDKGFTAEEDKALADAIARAGNVVLPTKFEERKTADLSQTRLDLPNRVFREGRAGLGYVNFFLDRDGFVRRLKANEEFQEEHKFPFSLAVLSKFEGKELWINAEGKAFLGERRLPDDEVLINYLGPPRSFPTVSFSEVYQGLLPPETFKDRIVLIGAEYKESHDLFSTPFFNGDGMYGVELHANAVDTFFSGAFIKGFSDWQILLLVLTVAALGAVILLALKPLPGLAAAFILVAAIATAEVLAFSGLRLWIRLVEPVLALFFCYVGAVLYRYLLEEREKRELKGVFSRFVAPQVVEQILRADEGVVLGGETREVTVFFSDIRGFTPMSEKMSPQEIVVKLNEYFCEMVEIIFKYGGTLNKFIGDAIMAIYGAPLPMENPEERAVRACLEMRGKLAELNARWQASGGEPIRIGMGLHRGEVVVGYIGSPRQMEYTVIGDAVNIGSRIESLTKELKTDILISDEVFARVRDILVVESPPPIAAKGKSVLLQVHKVIGLKGGG